MKKQVKQKIKMNKVIILRMNQILKKELIIYLKNMKVQIIMVHFYQDYMVFYMINKDYIIN